MNTPKQWNSRIYPSACGKLAAVGALVGLVAATLPISAAQATAREAEATNPVCPTRVKLK